MCEICGKRPKFIENGFQHPFCGRSCARQKQQKNHTACGLERCPSTAKTAFTGFCSPSHAREAVRLRQIKGCTYCTTAPATTGDLCAACDRRFQSGTFLQELDGHGKVFERVNEMFSGSWQALGSRARVEKVYKVIVSQDDLARKIAYREKLTSTGTSQTLHTYHSSQCICNLGVKSSTLCDILSCGICQIVKSSFKAFAFGVPSNAGRYGDGIYSYQNPAKADHFASSCTTSPYRVMIISDVTTAPPTRRWLTASKVNSIVDDERVFVNNPDAIIARYVILYKF